jgi:hypothetical protein
MFQTQVVSVFVLAVVVVVNNTLCALILTVHQGKRHMSLVRRRQGPSGAPLALDDARPRHHDADHENGDVQVGLQTKLAQMQIKLRHLRPVHALMGLQR